MVAVFRLGAEIPVLCNEIVIIGKFIMEQAVMFNAAKHGGIDVYSVIPDLFQEGLGLRGNLAVLLNVVVSRDDEEVFFWTAGGFQNGFYFFINGMVLAFLPRLGDVAGEADGMDIRVGKKGRYKKICNIACFF